MIALSMVVTALPALIAVAFGRDRTWLLIVKVPVLDPATMVLAAPPIFKPVALALNRLAVPTAVVAIVPELALTLPTTARVPPIVTAPPNEPEPSTPKLPLNCPVPVERVIPFEP